MISRPPASTFVVSVEGDVDDRNVHEFRASLAAAAAERPSRLLVDLRLAGHFGTHGVNSLVVAWREIAASGGELIIVNTRPAIRAVLAICRVVELAGVRVENPTH